MTSITNSPSVSAAERWQLDVYELNRTPHHLVTGSTQVTVDEVDLRGLITCPICLDVLDETMTTTCLHRFCQQCITTALRSGNKECPNCREKLVSRRSLRPDKNYDALISSICGKGGDGRRGGEGGEEDVDGEEEGEEGDKVTVRRSRIKTRLYEKEHPQATPAPVSIIPSPVDILCKPHPKLKHLTSNKEYIRYFQTSGNATVEHVTKYLYIKFQHQNLLAKLSKHCVDEETTVTSKCGETKKHAGGGRRWRDRHQILDLHLPPPSSKPLGNTLTIQDVRKMCAGSSTDEGDKPVEMLYMVHSDA